MREESVATRGVQRLLVVFKCTGYSEDTRPNTIVSTNLRHTISRSPPTTFKFLDGLVSGGHCAAWDFCPYKREQKSRLGMGHRARRAVPILTQWCFIPRLQGQTQDGQDVHATVTI